MRMTSTTNNTVTGSTLRRCVRCGYDQRGLAARHACPECGLRYDEYSAWFPVTNPRAVLAFWLCIFGGGWVNLKTLPLLGRLGALPWYKQLFAFSGLIWLACVLCLAVWMIRLYRRGQGVGRNRRWVDSTAGWVQA